VCRVHENLLLLLFLSSEPALPQVRHFHVVLLLMPFLRQTKHFPILVLWDFSRWSSGRGGREPAQPLGASGTLWWRCGHGWPCTGSWHCGSTGGCRTSPGHPPSGGRGETVAEDGVTSFVNISHVIVALLPGLGYSDTGLLCLPWPLKLQLC